MKNRRKAFIYLTLLILWMIFIFFMSAKSGEVSDSQSYGVLSILDSMGININKDRIDFANFLLRKIAHFTEYMILAFLVINTLKNFLNTKKMIYVYSIIIVFVYACLDEFHQLFVPGREGALRDICIDTLGGFTLAIIVFIFNKLRKK
ncbi:VanZ family protein [Clostridium sp. BJN0001]|uniref:VanZ family protein n=1 Tax=Clostridium sp. BJN0001 TaxID=2930219 RepID=UPI001FD03C72|nr:VanZ family protein [Clostridium sp. BJN0001]